MLGVAAAFGLIPLWACAQQQRRFDIDEFRVEGNTLLPTADIETAVMPFLGEARTADEVEKARAALDALYARHGYPTATAEIPEQDPSDGIVVLRVVERRVGRLRVHGSRYFSLSAIRAAVPALAEGRVPDLNEVQREIISLNQWPDRTVTPVLRPGALPGTVDVDLNVKDTLPLHGSVELATRQSANTSALRTATSLSYGNLWQRGDAASVSYQVAPTDPADAQVFGASYLFRIPGGNLALLVSYLRTNSNVATVGGTDVIGRGTIAGARLQVPLGTEGDFSHSLSVGFDYKSFLDHVLLAGVSTLTPVTYLPLVAQYQASWEEAASETLLGATAVLGTRGLGSDGQAFDLKRFQASPDFTYLRWDASRRDDLPWGLQTWLHLTGQLSADPLISNEQFAVGGLDSVRGYLEAEALGDEGVAAQAELRAPALDDLIPGTTSEVRGYTFADGASVDVHNALPEQHRGYRLASTGAGVRVRVTDYLRADLIGTYALLAGPDTHSGTKRLLFRVGASF